MCQFFLSLNETCIFWASFADKSCKSCIVKWISHMSLLLVLLLVKKDIFQAFGSKRFHFTIESEIWVSVPGILGSPNCHDSTGKNRNRKNSKSIAMNSTNRQSRPYCHHLTPWTIQYFLLPESPMETWPTVGKLSSHIIQTCFGENFKRISMAQWLPSNILKSSSWACVILSKSIGKDGTLTFLSAKPRSRQSVHFRKSSLRSSWRGRGRRLYT